jgi:uncharacterized protein YndB with AHSA1/START domain
VTVDVEITKDPAALTLTVAARFDASVERVWQLLADPRTLERWWGPPAYPATVVDHDLTPGGRVSYFMTGPEGDKHAGWWRVIAVDAPHYLEVEDGFADDSGEPNPNMPTCFMRMTVEADGAQTRLQTVTTFPSTEAMEQMVGMGMVEGITEAIQQIPAVLAA